MFPSARGTVQIVLRGHRFDAKYNPRMGGGGTEERSGVISVPSAALADLVPADERLRVSIARDAIIRLD